MKIPFADALGAVHPRCSVEKHAMVMQGGRVRERICNMDQERVSRLNVDWRWPEHTLAAVYIYHGQEKLLTAKIHLRRRRVVERGRLGLRPERR